MLKNGAIVRVKNPALGGARYRVRGKQLSLLPGVITLMGEKTIQVTFQDGGTEYHSPDNLELVEVKSPLKWHGGKFYLAARINSLVPKNTTQYVEPFGGSLAVLLERDPSDCAEIVNDLNYDLSNFWFVLRSPNIYPEFLRRCQATAFSEHEFQLAYHRQQKGGYAALIDAAIDFFVLCRQSRAGCFKDFATLTRSRIRGGMNEQVSAWLSAVDRLPEVHARLQRVLILNRPALDVIQQQDSPDTFFYLDPPYHPDSRASVGQYAHEMNNNEHIGLLNMLSTLRGKFILSGYRVPLYDWYSDKHSWYRMDIKMPNHAAGGDDKREMTESLWLNYKP